MTVSMYHVSVPVFSFMLKGLTHVLGKAEAHARERKIEPAALLGARLSPDMFTLTRQVQIATDHAKGAPSRLTGRDIPKYEDNEASFADLKARIDKTLAYLESFSQADLDGAEDRPVVLKLGDRDVKLTGLDYLTRFATPNFYFHVTTAYDILRHNGVPLGKTDFFAAR